MVELGVQYNKIWSDSQMMYVLVVEMIHIMTIMSVKGGWYVKGGKVVVEL